MLGFLSGLVGGVNQAAQGAVRNITTTAQSGIKTGVSVTKQVVDHGVKLPAVVYRQALNTTSRLKPTNPTPYVSKSRERSYIMHPLSGTKTEVHPIIKGGYSVAEAALGMGRGTDINDPTENPIGKYLVKLGEKNPNITQPMESAFMQHIWAPKLQVETAIGQRVRASNNPELISALEVAKFVHSDMFNLDTPTGLTIEGSQALAGSGLAKGAGKLALGKGLKGVAGGTDMISGLLKGLSKIGKVAKPTSKALKTGSKAMDKVSSLKKTRSVFQQVAKNADLIRARNLAKPKVSSFTNYRGMKQIGTRMDNIYDGARSRVTGKLLSKADDVPKPTSFVNPRSFMKAADYTRPLKASDDVGGLSRLTTKVDELSDAFRASATNLTGGAAKTTTLWDKLKIAAVSAGAGGVVGIGGLTALGVFDEQPTNVGDIYGDEIPLQWQEYVDGKISELAAGMYAIQPGQETIDQLPESLQGTLNDGGAIAYDEEGNPTHLIGPEGEIIRELTDEEKAAVEALVEKPTGKKVLEAIKDNMPLIAGAAGLVAIGAAYYFLVYKPEKESHGYASSISTKNTHRRTNSWI